MDGQHVGVGVWVGVGVGGALGGFLVLVWGALSNDLGVNLGWIWAVPLGSGLGLAGVLIWHKLNRPTPPNTCPSCGYDTSGLPRTSGASGGPVCPECGQVDGKGTGRGEPPEAG